MRIKRKLKTVTQKCKSTHSDEIWVGKADDLVRQTKFFNS